MQKKESWRNNKWETRQRRNQVVYTWRPPLDSFDLACKLFQLLAFLQLVPLPASLEQDLLCIQPFITMPKWGRSIFEIQTCKDDVRCFYKIRSGRRSGHIHKDDRYVGFLCSEIRNSLYLSVRAPKNKKRWLERKPWKNEGRMNFAKRTKCYLILTPQQRNVPLHDLPKSPIVVEGKCWTTYFFGKKEKIVL